ncbi:MAG: hydantoinase/oxoprolinase family protein [Pirellulales bacterium]|nr:hydantoinase/oxoprolinase family protein [Pirellulales bacterium]
MHWLALDIGGAQLKAADGLGYAASQMFPLWEKPLQLTEALRGMLRAAPACDHLAVTMTGELADCFTTRTEGVQFILSAVSMVAEQRHTRVYLSDGLLMAPQLALRSPLKVAAANWHALAKYCGRFTRPGLAVLVDIGSTTTDIIPILDGKVATRSQTDTDRLLAGELVYTGVQRTPVAAVAAILPYRKNLIPAATERFATTWDVFITLGLLPEEPANLHTANGKPATRLHARDRLARMLCLDRDAFDEADAATLAEGVLRQQLGQIATGWGHVTGRFDQPVTSVVISGQGEFLARQLLERLRINCPVVALSAELGPQLSRCAPAHALAVLAREG